MDTEKVKDWFAARRVALVGLVAAGIAYSASAAVNLTEITNLIQAIVGIVPDLIDLVVGIAPLIVVIALIGFLVKFFPKILDMLNLK
jgi:hypothetical protein